MELLIRNLSPIHVLRRRRFSNRSNQFSNRLRPSRSGKKGTLESPMNQARGRPVQRPPRRQGTQPSRQEARKTKIISNVRASIGTLRVHHSTQRHLITV